MIDQKVAKRLLKPLLAMSMCPVDVSEIDLRAGALAKFARNEDHGRRVCEIIRGREQYFPTTTMIVNQCEQTPDLEQLQHARQSCRHCNGEGRISVDGPHGITAAVDCDHTGKQGNMGVRIPAALQSHYMREAQEAEQRKAAWLANPSNPMNKRR